MRSTWALQSLLKEYSKINLWVFCRNVKSFNVSSSAHSVMALRTCSIEVVWPEHCLAVTSILTAVTSWCFAMMLPHFKSPGAS